MPLLSKHQHGLWALPSQSAQIIAASLHPPDSSLSHTHNSPSTHPSPRSQRPSRDIPCRPWPRFCFFSLPCPTESVLVIRLQPQQPCSSWLASISWPWLLLSPNTHPTPTPRMSFLSWSFRPDITSTCHVGAGVTKAHFTDENVRGKVSFQESHYQGPSPHPPSGQPALPTAHSRFSIAPACW